MLIDSDRILWSRSDHNLLVAKFWARDTTVTKPPNTMKKKVWRLQDVPDNIWGEFAKKTDELLHNLPFDTQGNVVKLTPQSGYDKIVEAMLQAAEEHLPHAFVSDPPKRKKLSPMQRKVRQRTQALRK
jgi:hypothetical protein